MPSKEQLIEENEKLQEVIVSIHDTLLSLFEYINDNLEFEDVEEDEVDDAEFDIDDEEDKDEEEECDFCGK